MSEITLTIDQIEESPHNVRTNDFAKTHTEALEASILAKGLLQRIIVHPLENGRYGAIAGDRRRRSIRNLTQRGALPRDWPVPVDLREGLSIADLIDISLDENFRRLDLEPYEVYAAVVALKDAGLSVEDISTRQGQSMTWVRQALRLGDLAPPVFAALRENRISIEQARAFGAVADRQLQAQAFDALMAGPPAARTEAAIRAWYRIEDREAEKLLRFVGVEAYREAGGWYEHDLFDTGADARGRVSDDLLLRRLADTKKDALRAAIRTKVGRPDLRFEREAPRNPEFGGQDAMLYVQPGGSDESELPEGDVVAVLRIEDDGTSDVSFWWASRKALAQATGPAKLAPKRPSTLRSGSALDGRGDGIDDRRKADAAIREDAGLTAEGTQTLRSARRSILRAALIDEARRGPGHLGRDYLVWAQLRMHLSTAGQYGYPERAQEVGMVRLGTPDQHLMPSATCVEAADEVFANAIAQLGRERFMTDPDLPIAFDYFLSTDQSTRDLAAAVVAGLALERSLEADGYRVPVHDTLAARAGIRGPRDIRQWWTPDAAFLDLLPTAERLAITEPFVDGATLESWRKKRSAELTALVGRVVDGTAPSIRRSLREAARAWVHPLLMFRRGGHPLGASK